MAFTAAELLQIETITGLNRFALDQILDNNATYITAEREAAVQAQLTRWDTLGSQFVRLKAMESNFGVETDSGNAKSDIRKNIATLLFLTDYISSGSAQGVLVRG